VGGWRLVGGPSPRGKSAAEGKTWLVGDVGATHSRFGLVMSNGELLHSRTLADEEYRTIDDALAAFLAESGSLPLPREGAIRDRFADHRRPCRDDQSSLELFRSGS